MIVCGVVVCMLLTICIQKLYLCNKPVPADPRDCRDFLISVYIHTSIHIFVIIREVYCVIDKYIFLSVWYYSVTSVQR